MAKAPPKKKEKIDPKDLAALHARAKVLGKQFDTAPISLSKGGYVGGAVSFGSVAIDLITGGGLPPGRLSTTSGPSMSGKSTLTYQATANAIDLGIPVIYLDHEASADANYLTALGVPMDEAQDESGLFLYSQPTAGENSYRYIHQMLDSMPVKNTSEFALPQIIVVVDSAAAMLPEDEEEDPSKNSQMAGPAKVHAWGMRLIKSKLSKVNGAMLMTNQIRQKPGIAYGNPEYEPGGQSMLFYPDLKIQMRGTGKMNEERGRGMRACNIQIAKNKQFPPFLTCKDHLQIAFGYGFDRFYDGLAYLKMTGQAEYKTGKGKGWVVTGMPDYKTLHGKTIPAQDFFVELFKNDFREAVRDQMMDGSAFDRMFATMKWTDMYKYDPENSGVGDGVDPGDVSEAEAMAAATEIRAKVDLDELNAGL